MPLKGQCTVCARGDIEEINNLLMNPHTIERDVARQYDIHPATLNRHKKTCLIERGAQEIARLTAGHKDELTAVREMDKAIKAASAFHAMTTRLGELMTEAEELNTALRDELKDENDRIDKGIASLLFTGIEKQEKLLGRYVQMAGELREQERHQWARREHEYRQVQDALADMVRAFPDAAAWLDERLSAMEVSG